MWKPATHIQELRASRTICNKSIYHTLPNRNDINAYKIVRTNGYNELHTKMY